MAEAQPSGAPRTRDGPLAVPAPRRRWSLARFGWLLLPLFGPWVLLAYFLPSPAGVYLPAEPDLIFLALIAAFLFGFGLLRTPKKWTPEFRRTAAVGLAVGLIAPGLLAGVALANHCPLLTPFTTSEPGGWERVTAPLWTIGGAPVLFFDGSVACPYCSASSWAVLAALERVANVSSITFDHSSPTDSYANTPSVVLPALEVSSPYVSLNAHEALSDTQIESPSLDSCTEMAYASAYNPLGGIPFVVIGGQFFHQGTLVDPGALGHLTATQLASEARNGSGIAWSAIGPAYDDLLAFLVYENGGQPRSVANDPAVAPVLASIH
ncbi:MAG TPA: DUF929 family protein [Thermoplasmata archaeon]|nr:DUF929 family protein [Thermoplasmata archaeon]